MNNGQLNRAFLNYTTPQMKSIILENISKHYEICVSEAEQEVTDEESENIMDYITGNERSAIHVIYQIFICSIK